LPIKTHGARINQLPFVTAKDALGRFEGRFEAREAPFPADHVKLVADRLAPAVWGSQPHVHYSEHRRLAVDELAALQSFPVNFFVAGNLTEQRKQIGNAVPVELATATARSIRASLLLYRYAEEDRDF
jgi:site-specific DNA-cytosine methylase